MSSALADVDYFTVARRGESLKDETGNDPIDSDGNDIAAGDDDADAGGIITDNANCAGNKR